MTRHLARIRSIIIVALTILTVVVPPVRVPEQASEVDSSSTTRTVRAAAGGRTSKDEDTARMLPVRSKTDKLSRRAIVGWRFRPTEDVVAASRGTSSICQPPSCSIDRARLARADTS